MEPSEVRATSTPLDDKVLTEIRRQLAQGNKIEAIKTLRAATGVDLTAAKNAVEKIEAGVAPRAHAADLSNADSERIQSALLAGKKSEAIRIFREATGSDLKTSHDAVVAFAAARSITVPRSWAIQPILAVAVLALLVALVVKFVF